MEGKQLSAVAPAAVPAPSMVHEEEAMRPMEQLKMEVGVGSTEQRRWGCMRETAQAWTQWASIKSKARAAGEYAVLKTRQGITMFGEPSPGPLVKPAAASEEAH